MSTVSDIGWLAYAASIAAVSFLVVPAFWLWRMWVEGVRDSHFVELAALVAAGVTAAICVVPATRLDIGWVLMPVHALVVCLSYLSAHTSARLVLELHQRREGRGVLLAFLVPMMVLAFALTMIASTEIGMVTHGRADLSGDLGPTVYGSMLVLTLSPPYAASFAIIVTYVRGVLAERRERPMA